MPEISIIVPVYNKEKHLKESVEALRKQTLQDIEILLIDDGSTDASPDICDRYVKEDKRIKVIHQKNHGVSHARNTGIQNASGAYIGFCDADDLPDPDMYAYMLQLAKQQNADLIMIKSKVICENGKTADTSSGSFSCWTEKEPAVKEFLTNRFSIAVYTKLLRADLCGKIEFENGRKINEDKMYVLQALLHAEKICFSDVAKYKYFRREGSSSLCSFSDKFFDSIYFAKKIEQIVTKKFPELSGYAQAQTIASYLWVLKLMLHGHAEKKYPREYKKITDYLHRANPGLCRQYLSRKDFIKWRLFQIGTPFFKIGTTLFSNS